MTQLDLSGVIPPMITPLTTAGDVDAEASARLVNYFVDSGVAGVFILGSSGEGPWLDAAQRQQIIRATVAAAAGRVPVLVGILEPSTPRTLETVQSVVADGADAIVITSPYYFESPAQVQIDHFIAVAEISPVPVVLYNIPPTTHNPILPSTISQVVAIDNIVAIKDSAGDMANFTDLIALKTRRPALRVFQGAEQLAVDALVAGADGVVPGLANLVPEYFVKIQACVQAGDVQAARQIQSQLNSLWQLHTHGYWLACLKYAASLLGFGSGYTIAPGYRLGESAQAAVRALIAQYVDQSSIAK